MKAASIQFTYKTSNYLGSKRYPTQISLPALIARKLTHFAKLSLKLFLFLISVTLMTLALRSFHAVPAKPLITIDQETWKMLQMRDASIYSKRAVLENKEFDQEEDDRLFHLNQFDVKTATEKVDEKVRKLLNLLRHPTNLKIDNFAPKLGSYSVMKYGRRVPLSANQPVILAWWPPHYLLKDRDELLERNFQGICGNCRLTTDRRTLHRSAVVLFDNVPDKTNLEDLPPPTSRRPEQAYVLWHRETPAKTYHLRDFMQGTFDTMFNYTLSYRRDADIIWYLGNTDFAKRSIPAINHNYPKQFVDTNISAKRHLAVWVVSNCNKTKGAIARKKYAEQLVAAGLKVDLFGLCYGTEIPRKDFYEFLLPYKFYLAFENSWHCKDYLTEKFWRNGLMANVVPVIWGPSPEDVAAVAPPHSYIHSEDFASPGELVEYLNYLDNNDTAYREYFDWRLEPITYDKPIQMLRSGYEPPMCKICRVLTDNGGRLPYNVLPSLIDWLFIDDRKCLLFEQK